VTRFSQAVGWLALLVSLIPALDLLLVLVGSRLRLSPVYAMWYGLFAVVWFLAALPVVALLWVIPPLPRAAVTTVVVYLVALAVPLASPFARFPLHVIRCGHLPVVGSRFAGDATYTAPGSPTYGVSFLDDHFFCSREEAAAAGFRERLDPHRG
jgi:hypothetical protein